MNIVKEIGEAAVLENMAEECVELAHAALKLARILRGENPTDAPIVKVSNNVVEEIADVLVLCDAWIEGHDEEAQHLIEDEIEDTITLKRERWEARLEEAKKRRDTVKARDNWRMEWKK